VFEEGSDGDVENIAMTQAIYAGSNCVGTPLATSNILNNWPKCAMDVDNFNETGPVMVSYQCSPDTEAYMGKDGTVVQTIYDLSDPTCSSRPLRFSKIATGACELSMNFNGRDADDDGDDSVIDEDTDFHYETVTCVSENEVEVVKYHDPACQNVGFRERVTFEDAIGLSADSCDHMDGVYTKFKCYF